MDIIQDYYKELSHRQLEQFKAIGPLYRNWNERINLISRKDIDNFYEHHVLHSLSIAKVINFKPKTKILDAGTGGGFPGLPLAIMFPDSQFTLVDSIAKKLKVIDDVASEIGLTNLQTSHKRVEDLDDKYDFIVSRAVTKLDVMWGWTNKKISNKHFNDIENGLIYLKGGDLSTELPNNICVQITYLNELFKEAFFEEKAIVHMYKIQ